jgi:Undecaprenyl-phosphate galactose phosphotransferase WbaP
LLASVGIALLCRLATNPDASIWSYFRLWPFVLVFPAVYGVVGLYSGVALSPPAELRRITVTSSILYLLLAATTVSFRGAVQYVTWVVFAAIAVSGILVPLARAFVRQLLARQAWWGYPAVVFGSGDSVRSIVRIIQEDPWLGLKACAVVDEHAHTPSAINGVPVVRDLGSVPEAVVNRSSAYAVVPVSGNAHRPLLSHLERLGARFATVLLIPEFGSLCDVGVSTKSIGQMVGMELSKPSLLFATRWEKRILDLLLVTIGGILILPLACLIAICIKLDSPGPVLYGHRRIGYGGRHFKAWKFRSMKQDADWILEESLKKDPRLHQEWETTQKLRDDPRVTRTGGFLRKMSLDELPQLLNVLRGEMSLVGPRPIVDAEVARYGEDFDLYTRVYGGLTGLWQVSGRSNTSYEERVTLDLYYLRNWSVWLDLCILIRTVGVVLFSRGAY